MAKTTDVGDVQGLYGRLKRWKISIPDSLSDASKDNMNFAQTRMRAAALRAPGGFQRYMARSISLEWEGGATPHGWAVHIGSGETGSGRGRASFGQHRDDIAGSYVFGGKAPQTPSYRPRGYYGYAQFEEIIEDLDSWAGDALVEGME